MPAAQTVSVLLPVAVAGTYSYGVPAELTVAPGDIVAVPLGTRDVIGVVWDDPPDAEIGHNRLRPIVEKLDAPPLLKDLRAFVDWIADYTLTTRGMVLRMVLRARGGLEPEPPIVGVRLAGPPPERMTAARQRVLSVLEDGGAWSKSGLAAAASVSTGVVAGLVEAGTLAAVAMPARPVAQPPDTHHAVPVLNTEQQAAADALRKAVADGGFSVTLLDGITGSGKTEVYFEAVAAALDAGRQVLILIPEIALTGAFLERFAARFGTAPAEWHSEVAPRLRDRVWRGVATGAIRAVIGARSALFLPFRELGLIVVDEEHDLAYKQEDRVFYNARDMAVVRGKLAGFPLVLSSATPSIESRVNADSGRYRRIVLSDRYAEAKLPEIASIDMRANPPERGRFLSPPLVAAVAETLEQKQQALLFLNRRGYAPLTLCRTCGHRFQCPNCSTWLVEHRFRGALLCHHCGHSEPRPDHCPNCGDTESLVAVGPGVERLAEEVAARFPEARTIVMSSDMAGGIQRLRLDLQAIAKGEVDIVIGTQLVAKGHNFPLLTLVGVVDGDLGLAFGDMRAAERTFQLLSQVTGRAGRAGGASRALLQTYAPEHPVIRAIVSGDREAFYTSEIAARRAAGLPPFGRLVGIVISGIDRGETQAYAGAFRRAEPRAESIQVLGPAEAPLAVIRGRHRFRLLVQAPRNTDIQTFLRDWLAAAPRPRGNLRVQIDIDPQSFM
ncbi:primosomal protein N' [Bauldia litoralis]|uniref:Replication restart protein PriA n=1 Tax=Bauldia litoralis TaxID=665467 RepID=A0A1G6A9G2_9HYPH|nr:primosomal protein N' [Bauldia litoralis]SDB05064.1 replication restart DNA helicase PriA [Bauldia litoralis]